MLVESECGRGRAGDARDLSFPGTGFPAGTVFPANRPKNLDRLRMAVDEEAQMETDMENDFSGILKTLLDFRVDFIVVGGVAATLHGVPVATFDLDIVHSRTPENLERLERALNHLDARYRGDPRNLRPDREVLASSGHHLLMTRMGPLDVLGAIEMGANFDSLSPRSVVMEIEGNQFRVLTLETLIRLKEKSTHEKDLLRLPVLRRTFRKARNDGTNDK